MPAIGLPITLATNGTVREGARIDLEDVDVSALDGILDVHQAHHVERQRQVSRLLLDAHDDRGGERVGGQRAGAVTGMNARLLDVLQDAGDERVLAVAKAVDVDLDGVGEDSGRSAADACRIRRARRGWSRVTASLAR